MPRTLHPLLSDKVTIEAGSCLHKECTVEFGQLASERKV
jgi:hypothetical protein